MGPDVSNSITEVVQTQLMKITTQFQLMMSKGKHDGQYGAIQVNFTTKIILFAIFNPFIDNMRRSLGFWSPLNPPQPTNPPEYTELSPHIFMISSMLLMHIWHIGHPVRPSMLAKQLQMHFDPGLPWWQQTQPEQLLGEKPNNLT